MAHFKVRNKSFEGGTKLNGIQSVEPVDLISGIEEDLGTIFKCLQHLNIDKELINALYEVIRLEVI